MNTLTQTFLVFSFAFPMCFLCFFLCFRWWLMVHICFQALAASSQCRTWRVWRKRPGHMSSSPSSRALRPGGRRYMMLYDLMDMTIDISEYSWIYIRVYIYTILWIWYIYIYRYMYMYTSDVYIYDVYYIYIYMWCI